MRTVKAHDQKLKICRENLFKMAAVRTQMQQRVQKGLKLSKAERKILRKQNKALHTLKTKSQEVGEISHCPTPYLLVKNGGLMCGVERRDLFSVFQEYGALEDLVMVPGKSYSYALYLNVENAQKAMMNLSGRKILTETSLYGRTLYLAYLMKKPCLQMNCFDTSYPSGLVLIEDFIDESEESVLLSCFSNSMNIKEGTSTAAETVSDSVQKQLKHRYVKHYGYEFIYGSNTVDIEKPLSNGMPCECLPVIDKITSLECVKHRPDQLTINEYLPGQGIPPHTDTHSAFEDGIICLSLGATVAMDFRHPDGRHVPVLLPRRSVLLMTEDSRYVWTHGITPRKYDVVSEEDIEKHQSGISGDTTYIGEESVASPSVTLLPRKTRLSLTFRKVRTTPCDCNFPDYCDSKGCEANIQAKIEREKLEDCPWVPITERDAIDLERKHVYNVYENIAEHFSGTRHSPWPKIAEFLKAQPAGSLVADVGCGNGKYLGVNDQLFMSGSDRSLNLASICRDRGFQVIVCDILSLPYRSDVFDACICIAVIHHLSTSVRRLTALKELARIVRPGGRILVSVWALEQNLKNTKSEVSAKDITRDHCDSVPGRDTSMPHTNSCSLSSPTSSKADVQFSSSVCDGQQTSFSESTEKVKENKTSFQRTSRKLIVNTNRNEFEQQDLLVPWHYRGAKKTSNGSDMNKLSSPTVPGSIESNHMNVDGSTPKQERVFQRFYHVFKENELVDDCEKLKHVSIIRSYYDKGNWCVELRKIGGSEQAQF